jgi:hypothetical protein
MFEFLNNYNVLWQNKKSKEKHETRDTLDIDMEDCFKVVIGSKFERLN